MSFYSDASLVLIPSGVKTSKVYSQKPTDGTGDLTFSRASIATRTNSAGLIEKGRTNLQVYSEQFDNTAGWQRSGTTLPVVTANQSLAPNGTNTADKIVLPAVSLPATSSYMRNNASISSSGTNTSSVYLKGEVGGETVYVFMIVNSVYTSLLCTLTTNWQRFSYSYSGGGVMRFGIGCDLTAGSGMVAQPAATIYAWGAQVEVAEAVTDYIQTTASAVTVGPTNNVPRLDYSDGATCPRLLSEGQRTNLVLRSEIFDNASWTKTNVTITANATTSPDGTVNADKIVGSAVSGDKLVAQTQTITIAQALTVSAFYKKSEYKLAFLRVGGQATNPYVIYNLDTQAVVSTAGATSTTIEDYGNGWYRISLSLASPTGASCVVQISFVPDSGYTLSALNIPQYTGDGTSGGFAWGCQLEANGAAFGSTYIPTTTPAVTRVIDSVSISGASALIGQTEGTIFIDVDFRSVSTGGIRQFFALEGSVVSQFSGLNSGTTNNGNNVNFAGATYTLTQGRHKIVCT